MSARPPFELKKVTLNSLDPVIQDLLKEAVEVRKLAYAPYSNFKVGASLLCDDGISFTGCNVENSTFVSICAERTAYVKAVSEGKLSFKAIAVVLSQNNLIPVPCGTCRQFMSEFGKVDIYTARPNLEEVYVTDLDELLPFQFKPNTADS